MSEAPIMKRMLMLAVVICGMAGVAAAAPVIDPANPPQGKFVDEWYVIEMDRARAGYLHSTVTRDGNHMTSQSDMALTIRRGDAKAKIEAKQTARELLDGTPVGFDDTMILGSAPMRTVGRIRGGKIRLRDEQFGKKTEREFDFDMSARLPWGIYLEQRKHGFKPGTKFEIKTYESSLRPDGSLMTRVEVMGKEKVEVLGKTVEGIRVKETLEFGAADGKKGAAGGGLGAAAASMMGGELASTAWVDETGRILCMDTQVGGMFKIRMVQSTREEALKDADAGAELFISMMIPVKQRINEEAAEITYRVSTKDGQPLTDLPDTGMQHFKRTNANSGELTVRRIAWEALRGKQVQAAKGDGDIYLKASLTADSDDPAIRKLAREAAGGEKAADRVADKLRRFVSEYITKKDMDVGFATASEVAKTREGDCSEHAVLLAAMCRAAGLPSRGVAGIVKVPGRGPTQFGYHMWTQVRIDGGWADIDAALEETDCDATHIALTILDLGDSGIGDASLRMLPMLGRLKLEVTDSKAR